MYKNLMNFVGIVGLSVIISGCSVQNYDLNENPVVLDEMQDEFFSYPQPKVEFTKVQKQIYGVMKEYLDNSSYSPMSLLASVMENPETKKREYTAEDVNFVIVNLDIDWQEKSEVLALEHIKTNAISKDGLIDYLTFLRIPEDDVIKAVDNVDIDWEKETAERISELEDSGSYTKDEIINKVIKYESHPEEFVSKYFNK